MKTRMRLFSFILVMLLTACAFTAGAGAIDLADVYSDFAIITYREAAQVVTAYRLYEGDSPVDGLRRFRPDERLSRAEAAKLAAFAALGPQEASRIEPATTRFVDLEGYEWASGYIKYCQENGIINGISADMYNPSGHLTHFEMLKLMVCTLGYGANGECTGSSWKLAVAGYANSAGLTSGLLDSTDFDYGKEIDREEAALYLYNALRADMVAYYDLLKVYYPRDINGEALVPGLSMGTPVTLLRPHLKSEMM